MATINRKGQPPKYKTVDEMKVKIDKYFKDCQGNYLRDEKGRYVFDHRGNLIIVDAVMPTITGLAYALGFKTRKSLIDYQGKKEFNKEITRAKLKIEMLTEEKLFDAGACNGAKFVLMRNFHWGQFVSDEKSDNRNAQQIIISGL